MGPILHDRWTVDVSLTPAELMRRFSDNVRPKRSFRELWAEIFKKDADEKPFEGVVSEDHFKIQRVIHYRNSFLPTVIGTLKPTASGTRVSVVMRLHPGVAAFMGFWLAGVGSGALVGTAAMRHQGQAFPLVMVPLGMILFMVTLSVGAFEVERRKARRLLLTLLQPITK